VTRQLRSVAGNSTLPFPSACVKAFPPLKRQKIMPKNLLNILCKFSVHLTWHLSNGLEKHGIRTTLGF
jgi:hypothetical protein